MKLAHSDRVSPVLAQRIKYKTECGIEYDVEVCLDRAVS